MKFLITANLQKVVDAPNEDSAKATFLNALSEVQLQGFWTDLEPSNLQEVHLEVELLD